MRQKTSQRMHKRKRQPILQRKLKQLRLCLPTLRSMPLQMKQLTRPQTHQRNNQLEGKL